MRDIPAGVLLLYTNSSRPYTTRLHSTSVREFVPDPLLHPSPPKFEPEAPLRMIKKLPKSVDNLDK
jgi:hypothetical protein